MFNSYDYPIFTVDDVKLALKAYGATTGYVHLMLHNLSLTNRIYRVKKGVYTFHDDSVVVGFAFQPFYYGIESALWLMGISGQGANYVIMTNRNVREGIRKFKNRNYRVKRIDSSKMFGYNLMRYENFWIPVSDIEKTVIDIVRFYGHIEKEIIPTIEQTLNKKKLKNYLKRFDAKLYKKVFYELQKDKK